MGKFINGKTNYEEWRDHSCDNAQCKARMAIIEKGISSLADEMRMVQAVHISEMSGKLEGYYSLSTSVLMNPICQARARVPGSICAKCYAANTASRYNHLMQCLETNYLIMNGFLISETAWATLSWPTTNGDARIESFGDVATVTCAQNYLRIIKSHPWLNFGVWTKNTAIWNEAIHLEGGKPSNMKYVISSTCVDVPDELDAETAELADHRFTVYSNDGEHINCGGRKCATCRKCYGNGVFDIAEHIK